MTAKIDNPNVPAFATVVDWCRLSGMGRTATYHALMRGDLRARKLGKRTLIDVRHGLAWMGSLPLATVTLPGFSRTTEAA